MSSKNKIYFVIFGDERGGDYWYNTGYKTLSDAQGSVVGEKYQEELLSGYYPEEGTKEAELIIEELCNSDTPNDNIEKFKKQLDQLGGFAQ